MSVNITNEMIDEMIKEYENVIDIMNKRIAILRSIRFGGQKDLVKNKIDSKRRELEAQIERLGIRNKRNKNG